MTVFSGSSAASDMVRGIRLCFYNRRSGLYTTGQSVEDDGLEEALLGLVRNWYVGCWTRKSKNTII